MKYCLNRKRDPLTPARAAALLGALLVLAVIWSLCAGASGLSLREALLHDGTARRILRYIRLPRTVAAVACGTALACAGAVIQGVLGNPLAGPNVIGVNAGAGFAMMLTASLVPYAHGWLGGAAAAGAFLACLFMLLLVRRTKASRITVVLAGVAVSAILSAGTDILTTLFPESMVGLTQFRIGGFADVNAASVYQGAMFIAFVGALVLRMAGRLNVLSLGEETAKSVGLDVPMTRTLLLLYASALVGTSVSFAGLIGFVGLVSPHMVRRLCRGDYRKIVPLSALAGAVMTLVCDTVARTAFAPYELPAGVLLSLIGGPFFLVLLLKGGRLHDRNA